MYKNLLKDKKIYFFLEAEGGFRFENDKIYDNLLSLNVILTSEQYHLLSFEGPNFIKTKHFLWIPFSNLVPDHKLHMFNYVYYCFQ